MGEGDDKTKAYVKAAAYVIFSGLLLWVHSGAASKKCDEKCGTAGKKCC